MATAIMPKPPILELAPSLPASSLSTTEQLLLKFLTKGDVEDLKRYVALGGGVNVLLAKPGGFLLGSCAEPLLAKVSASFDVTAMDVLLNTSSCDINIQDQRNYTPLMYAVKRSSRGGIQALLKSGADPNIRTKLGETALTLAIQKRSDEIVALLLSHGASPNIKIHTTAVGKRLDYPEPRWISPVVLCLKTNPSATSMLIRLVKAGALPEVFDQSTVFDICRRCIRTWKEVIDLLIQCGFIFEFSKLRATTEHAQAFANHEFRQFIASLPFEPLSLQQLCRIQIRTTLSLSEQGNSLSHSVGQLPLPKPLINYVKIFTKATDFEIAKLV